MWVDVQVKTESIDDDDGTNRSSYDYTSSTCVFESVSVAENLRGEFDFEVDAKPGDTVFVLIEHYSDGDTFGNHENMQARGVFKTFEAAELASESANRNGAGYFQSFLGWLVQETTVVAAKRPTGSLIVGEIVESVWHRPGSKKEDQVVALVMASGKIALWKSSDPTMTVNFKGQVTEVSMEYRGYAGDTWRLAAGEPARFTAVVRVGDRAWLTLDTSTSPEWSSKLTPKKKWEQLT